MRNNGSFSILLVGRYGKYINRPTKLKINK